MKTNNAVCRCKNCHGLTSVDELFNGICSDCWAEMEEQHKEDKNQKYDNFYDYYPEYEATLIFPYENTQSYQ